VIDHACPKCGEAVSGKGRCARCMRPVNKRINAEKNARPQRRVYGSTRWKTLSAKIIHRDKGICQACGGRAETAAHIQPFRDHSDPLAWNERNLRAECRSCNGREGGKRGADIRLGRA
jgi:5-methylcytosine-specific restriction endonuclease McrA